MDRDLLARLGSRSKVIIIPTAAARENPALAAENGVHYFQRLGAQAGAAMVIDAETARSPILSAQIQEADLLYFTGGDPLYLLETMRNSAAWKAAQEVPKGGRILAGSSAGAMILGGQMWAPGRGWREGLGLLPQIAVIPHHSSLAPRWNAAHMSESLRNGVILVGIDEATALVGPPWQVLGPGQVTVYRGKKPAIFKDGQDVPLPE
jgi:cyanophycinase